MQRRTPCDTSAVSAGISRHAFARDQASEVLAFVAAHPLHLDLTPTMARMLLCELAAEASVIDLWRDGERALVACVVDADDAAPSPELVILGASVAGLDSRTFSA